MAVTATDTAAVVARALARTPNLPTLPDVTLRIIQLANSPDTSVQQMTAVVSTAPVLALTMLRVVNSAFYGLPGRVTTIERAVSLLGVTGVRNLAIATSMSRVFTGHALTATFSPAALWSHSLAVATATQLLAARARHPHPDEAFLSGLIHDLGFMIELHTDRHALTRVVQRLDADPTGHVLDIERDEFGATHVDFGVGLCDRWHIPAVLTRAMAGHHAPLSLDAGMRDLAALVFLGDVAATHSVSPHPLDRTADEDVDAVLWAAHLTRAHLDEVTAALPAAVDAARVFD